MSDLCNLQRKKKLFSQVSLETSPLIIFIVLKFRAISYCRSLCFLGDSSVYRINGSQVTLAKYLEALEKIGIVTKARNCLVFQVKTVLKVSVDRHEIML